MRKVSHSMPLVEPTDSPRTTAASQTHPAKMSARVLIEAAARWGRRALFYERHRAYFPRLSGGGFVASCRDLEATYLGLSRVIQSLTPQAALIPIRSAVSRKR